MINILLNISNFDEEWAYPSLENILTPDKKVLILPLSYNEGWITDAYEWKRKFGKGRRNYEEIVRPFRSYGITDRQIKWINYYTDDEFSARRKIEKADVLFFTGGYPDWMMQRLYDLGIQDDIRNFKGIVMGTSAGACIQLDEFHLPAEDEEPFQYQEGLGLLSGFDIDVHFEEDLVHLEALIRSLEDMGKPIIAYPNQGGVIIEGDHFELLGGAFVVDVNDLNDLYKTYDYLRYEI
ncbi:MAG: Type 1 glutamine amidotransferase-like domain-containing protein [Solobacterium sp.]|nr:Type 1 glutamine amidotransferase-like domain-containing protein [Solobacterium sp.]